MFIARDQLPILSLEEEPLGYKHFVPNGTFSDRLFRGAEDQLPHCQVVCDHRLISGSPAGGNPPIASCSVLTAYFSMIHEHRHHSLSNVWRQRYRRF
jgi:hypothetical protein